MNHEDYVKAAEHWKIKDAESMSAPQEHLIEAAREYILKNNTCALATGTGDFIRCTPIEYSYYKDAFWMFSEGGEKFIALEQNKHVCIAIYDKYDGFGNLKGMQVSGTAELIEPFSPEYIEAAESKKIPLQALKQLPEPMNLIKVTPERIQFLNSDFKKEGYRARQELILKH